MYSYWHSMHCKSCKSKDCLVIYVRSLTTGRDYTIACPATECDCFVFYPFSEAANRDRHAAVLLYLKVGLRYVKTLQDWCEAARPIVHDSIDIVIQPQHLPVIVKYTVYVDTRCFYDS